VTPAESARECESAASEWDLPAGKPEHPTQRALMDAAALIRAQAAEVERLRAQAADAEYELTELTCVMDAKFRAAMAGESFDDLDAGLAPETVKREQEALVRIVEKHGASFVALRAERDAMRGVVGAARELPAGHEPPEAWCCPSCRMVLALRALDGEKRQCQ
jgi:hypothetical protein